MKRFFVILICVLPVLFTAACTSSSSAISFTDRKPWQFNASSSTSSERISLSAKRYSHSANSATLIAEGDLVFTLREGRDRDNPSLASLTTSLDLLHNTSSESNGRSDSILSETIFSAASLLPISATKTLTLGSLVPAKGYTTATDYVAKSTTVTPLGGDPKTFPLKSGGYYDNELLYHLARAIPGLSTGKNFSFSVLTPYDVFVNNGFTVHDINISVATELARLEVPKSVFDIAIPREGEDSGKLNNDGVYEIDCLALKMTLDAEQSGPSIFMYLSDLRFVENDIIRENYALYPNSFTALVPVKIVVSEYSINNALLTSTEYTIKSYTNIVV